MSTDPDLAAPPRSTANNFVIGAVSALLAPLVLLLAAFAVVREPEMVLIYGGMLGLAVGVVQLVYILPACFVAYQTGYRELFKGLLAGAAGVFLLNAACWGMVAFNR